MTSKNPSEYGGADAGQRRPDGSLRHAGQPASHNPTKAKDLRRNLMLSGDASGDAAPDSDFHGQGLDEGRFEELNKNQANPSLAHNRLTDP